MTGTKWHRPHAYIKSVFDSRWYPFAGVFRFSTLKVSVVSIAYIDLAMILYLRPFNEVDRVRTGWVQAA